MVTVLDTVNVTHYTETTVNDEVAVTVTKEDIVTAYDLSLIHI